MQTSAEGPGALPQVQLAQMQQQTLAMQVAQMRVQAKVNPGSAVTPGKLPAVLLATAQCAPSSGC